MVKKGLSYEEKRTRMLEYFWEVKEVCTLKELEKVLPKLKGIVNQAVKEVLQSLVDDELVDYDRIGAGNYYWSFPSQASVARQNKLASLAEKQQQVDDEIAALEEQKRILESNRVQGDERSAKLNKLESNRQELETLISKLQHRAENGPEALQKADEKKNICRDGANRWTDNLYTMIKVIKEKRPDLTECDILVAFGLPTELDYAE